MKRGVVKVPERCSYLPTPGRAAPGRNEAWRGLRKQQHTTINRPTSEEEHRGSRLHNQSPLNECFASTLTRIHQSERSDKEEERGDTSYEERYTTGRVLRAWAVGAGAPLPAGSASLPGGSVTSPQAGAVFVFKCFFLCENQWKTSGLWTQKAYDIQVRSSCQTLWLWFSTFSVLYVFLKMCDFVNLKQYCILVR